MTSLRSVALRAAVSLAVALVLIVLLLPMVALLVRLSPIDLLHRMQSPVVGQALKLSLETSLVATAAMVVLGLPVAWLLATKKFPGRRLLDTLVHLPIVLPPTVAGVGLLLAFGRAGIAGHVLQLFGLSLPFTTLAVIVAQFFVATPFFISSATAGMMGVERRYLDAASTSGARSGYTFFRVLLPLAMPSIIAGAAMSWARALGEFGATIIFAGNLAGRTQTMPLAVYSELQMDFDSAVALSVVLLVLSFSLLLGLRSAPIKTALGGYRAES